MSAGGNLDRYREQQIEPGKWRVRELFYKNSAEEKGTSSSPLQKINVHSWNVGSIVELDVNLARNPSHSRAEQAGTHILLQ